MKLSAKLYSAMGGLTAVIAVVGLFSLYQMRGINNAVEQLAVVSMPSIMYMDRINTLTSDFRIQEVLHIYSEDPKELAEYDKNMNGLWAEIQSYEAEYDKLPRTAEEESEYQSLLKALDEYKAMNARVTELSRSLRTQEAIQLLLTDSKKIYDLVSSDLAQIADLNTDGGRDASREAKVVFDSAQMLIIGLLLAAVLTAAALSILIVRGVLRQLGKDPGELGELAHQVAQGRLDIADDGRATGVYANILVMVESLKTSIQNAQEESRRAREESEKARVAMQEAESASAEAKAKSEAMLRAADRLEEVANIVSSASTELSAQIEQSSHGASEQSSRMGETATAMEEMNSTVMEVAKNAGSAFDVSAATRQKAEEGASVVDKAVGSIRKVRADSLVLKEDMGRLSDSAQAISQIMSVISDIADQTNLLALNAAIEAARAGDAGRGFAVVADEVRNLAEKTMASTTDVGNAIKAIQESAAQSMQQVDAAVQGIEDATTFANQSGDALSEIVAMVDGTADQVRAIAAASEEQSAASEEINRSISQVNTIANETAQAMNEAAKAVSELAGQANNLSRLIDDMKRV